MSYKTLTQIAIALGLNERIETSIEDQDFVARVGKPPSFGEYYGSMGSWSICANIRIF